jgi:hypothetical protein
MKTYERELPDGYQAVRKIDVNNKKFNLKLSLASVVLMFAVLIPAVVLLISRYGMVRAHFVWLFIIFFIYMICHELTHGIVYYALTRHKLKFGISLNSLYCGVPDVYTYRSTSLAALLAPFILFSVLFLLGIFLCSPEWKLVFAFELAGHVGGCGGDLYEALLFLFKYRSPSTLMKDTGPVQTFYEKTSNVVSH